MDKKKKIILILMITLVVIILGIVGTYAWYVWNTSDDDTTNIVTSVGAATVTYDAGADLVGQSLRPVGSRVDGISKNIKIKTDGNSVSAITFNLYLDINTLDDGLKHESFKYELYKGSTLKKSGDFSQSSLNTNLVTCNTNSTNHIVLLTNETISTTLSTYTLYLWIDGANYTNPSTMMNKNFSFKLHADGQNAVVDDLSGGNSGGTGVATWITNLYNNAEKEEYTSADGLTYNLASSVHLMNDRLGSSSTNINDGNIRFYGRDTEVNNYVDIGDRTIDGEVIPYRIIGLFKDIEVVNDNGTTEEQDLIKVIRADSIGTYSWDNKPNGIGSSTSDYGSNNWADARLMMLLNPDYENNVYDTKNNLLNEHNRSYYWNSTGTSFGPVKCYSEGSNATADCYFESTGLSSEARSKIAKTTWTIGSFSSGSVYGNSAYQTERAGTEWQGNVALMYVSDMYYSRNLKQCTGNLSGGCNSSSNWLFLGGSEWSLASGSSYEYGVLNISSGRCYTAIRANYSQEVRPVFYLKSELGIESEHAGTRTEPYRIS